MANRAGVTVREGFRRIFGGGRGGAVALLVGCVFSYLNGLLLEALVFFGEASEEERVGCCRTALYD